MLVNEQTLANLRSTSTQSGKLVWIGIRPARHEAMIVPSSARLITDSGIESDHSATQTGKKRQITLIQSEHLPVIATLTNKTLINPKQLRRNLVIAGINVLSLKDQIFTIGNCILEGTGPCHPCSRMEETLGTGGYNAMRGHGGITEKVIAGGIVSIEDEVLIKTQ